jgi:hypothetical protein
MNKNTIIELIYTVVTNLYRMAALKALQKLPVAYSHIRVVDDGRVCLAKQRANSRLVCWRSGNRTRAHRMGIWTSANVFVSACVEMQALNDPHVWKLGEMQQCSEPRA